MTAPKRAAAKKPDIPVGRSPAQERSVAGVNDAMKRAEEDEAKASSGSEPESES